MVRKLEELLGRRLHVIGCSLHQNELPLRAVFKSLDGTTTSPDGYFSFILNSHETVKTLSLRLH